jgi:hypothetical protein
MLDIIPMFLLLDTFSDQVPEKSVAADAQLGVERTERLARTMASKVVILIAGVSLDKRELCRPLTREILRSTPKWRVKRKNEE